MFKFLVWTEEKENRYKAVVDVSSGVFRNHLTYRVFYHKEGYWRVLVTGSFLGVLELERSPTKESAFRKAESDYQSALSNLQDILNSLKKN